MSIAKKKKKKYENKNVFFFYSFIRKSSFDYLIFAYLAHFILAAE